MEKRIDQEMGAQTDTVGRAAQDVHLCMQVMNTIHLHVAKSFAEVAKSLLEIQHEAEGTKPRECIAQMNEYLLQLIAKQYAEMVEVTFQQLMDGLKTKTIPISFHPYTDLSEDDELE